jgi:hypothetical protein
MVVWLFLGTGTFVRADDMPKAIIEKAIKATGGEEKLGKYKAATWKAKGKINFGGTEIEWTGDFFSQPPKQMKSVIEVDFNGMKLTFIRVSNGDKGWIVQMGNTDEMSGDQLADAKEELYSNWISTLMPLKDGAFALAPLGESKVGDRPVVGVKVSHKEHKDVSLFFDKEKGLLVKSLRRVKDMMTGQEVDQETVYSDFKETDGIQRSMKMVAKRDGKDYLEAVTTEFKVVDKLDDGLFGKPSQ